MVTHRRKRLASAGVVAATLGVLALSGCSNGAPSVAAYVGDAQISQQQLSDAADSVAEAIGPDNTVDPRGVLAAMIGGVVAEQIAARHGIEISDAERDSTLRSDPTGLLLLENPDAREVGYDIADQSLVSERLGTQAYQSALEDIQVKLNPRYGTWQDNAVQDQSTSLSELDPKQQP